MSLYRSTKWARYTKYNGNEAVDAMGENRPRSMNWSLVATTTYWRGTAGKENNSGTTRGDFGSSKDKTISMPLSLERRRRRKNERRSPLNERNEGVKRCLTQNSESWKLSSNYSRMCRRDRYTMRC